MTQSVRHDRPWLRRLAQAVLVVIGVLAVATLVAHLLGFNAGLSRETLFRHRAMLDAFIAAHYALAILAYIGVYIALAALSIPGGAALTVAGGFLFGWLVGGLATLVGATIGATIIFLIARSAFGEAIVRKCGSRAAKIAEGLRADGFSYLLFLRLVPAFPFFLVNIAPALVGIGLRTFIVATAIGIIPGTFAFALLGDGLAKFGEESASVWVRVAELAAPILVIAIIPVVVRKWRARRGVAMPG